MICIITQYSLTFIKGRPPSSRSVARGATAAGNVVRALSRPGSARSVAWSDPAEDEEAAKRRKEEEEAAERKRVKNVAPRLARL